MVSVFGVACSLYTVLGACVASSLSEGYRYARKVHHSGALDPDTGCSDQARFSSTAMHVIMKVI